MCENFYAEYAGTLSDGSKVWWAKYRFQQTRVFKAVNDRFGLVAFNSEEAATDAAMKAHSRTYQEAA